MTDSTARAVAHSNIALVKYWGKSDVRLNLPAVPSLSLTLDALKTRTEVHFDKALCTDEVTLDGSLVSGHEQARVVALLDRVRTLASIDTRARVVSTNDFPTAAGLASSASGFAALAVAASAAAGAQVSTETLSAMARQSSASAARSLYGGFVNLLANAEHAVPVAPPDHWNLRLLVAVTETGRKPMGSTEAMETTRRESPYYAAWVSHAPALYHEAEAAVLQRNFSALGECMEQSTLMMHASMLATRPAILFMTEATWSVVRHVRQLRSEGLPCYFTIDAGPHVKVLVEAQHANEVGAALSRLQAVRSVISCGPGPGAHLAHRPRPTC